SLRKALAFGDIENGLDLRGKVGGAQAYREPAGTCDAVQKHSGDHGLPGGDASRIERDGGEVQIACGQQAHEEGDGIGSAVLRADGERDVAGAVQSGGHNEIELVEAEESGGGAGEFYGEVEGIAFGVDRASGEVFRGTKSGSVDGEARAGVVTILGRFHQEGSWSE